MVYNLVTMPFCWGSVFFTGGCYLTLLEVVNGNLQEEVARRESKAPAAGVRSDASGTVGLGESLLELSLGTTSRDLFDGRHRIRWWGWQPDSLLFWAALVQLYGALCFNVACFGGLPGAVTGGHMQEVVCVYLPSLVGSLCFTFACFVYLAEVTHSYNVLQPPEQLSLSYFVVIFNLIG